jgi:hypothetical protein
MVNKKSTIKIIITIISFCVIFFIGLFVGVVFSSNGKWLIDFNKNIENEFGRINRKEDEIIKDIPLNYANHLFIIVVDGVKTIRIGNIWD